MTEWKDGEEGVERRGSGEKREWREERGERRGRGEKREGREEGVDGWMLREMKPERVSSVEEMINSRRELRLITSCQHE